MLLPPPISTLFPYTTLFRSAFDKNRLWKRRIQPALGRFKVQDVNEEDAGAVVRAPLRLDANGDRKSTRLNSSHITISYAVFCLKKKKKTQKERTRIIYKTLK